MRVVVFHNPASATSRNVLKILERSGIEPQVVDYLVEGWTEPLLHVLFVSTGLTPRDALRAQGGAVTELGLTEPGVSDRRILSEMQSRPSLVNGPFVCSPKGVRLCRPSHLVLDLLDSRPEGPVFGENGEMLLNADGMCIDD